MKTVRYLLFTFVVLFTVSCKDLFQSLDVRNENQPNIVDLYTPKEFYSLLKNGYNTWYNGAIAASPSIAFNNAQLFACGTPGWGSGPLWQIPRKPLFNDQSPDPVTVINFGAWYNFYSGIGTAIKISKILSDPTYKLVLEGTDYTKRARAHSYIIQALLYGNIALLYDKAYLFTEEHDPLTFDYVANTKSNKEIMAFAIKRLNDAIALIESDNVDADYQPVMPGVEFNKEKLLQFANSMAARFLVTNARTVAENNATDWAKVKTYAEKGLTQDFNVLYEQGWRGKVMTRDEGANYLALYNWDWIRANQWLINKMAPNDPAAVYPWPVGVNRLGEVKNCPDARLKKYFKWDDKSDQWFGWSRVGRPGYGYFIRCEYKYWRYYDVINLEDGFVGHYLKAENDLYLAEAKIRLNQVSGAAALVNNTRVTVGGLSPATDGDADLMDKIFYERYVECDLVWAHLGYFDKRRLGQLLEGTAYHFPIPAPELIMHGQPVYTFGGVGHEFQ
jgi:hypothetical protein